MRPLCDGGEIIVSRRITQDICSPQRITFGQLDYYVSRLQREDATPHRTALYRTGTGPGSPRGQPAWGGGCDRDKDSTPARILATVNSA